MAANAELPANKSGIGGALAAQAPSGQNRLTGVPRALRRHRDRHITHVLQPVLDGRCLRTAAILKEAERDSLAYLDSHRRTRSPVHQQRPGADEPRDRARIEGDARIPSTASLARLGGALSGASHSPPQQQKNTKQTLRRVCAPYTTWHPNTLLSYPPDFQTA